MNKLNLSGNILFVIWTITIIFTNLFILLSYNTKEFVWLILGLMFLQLSYIFYTTYFHKKIKELEDESYYQNLMNEAFRQKNMQEMKRK